MILIGGETGDGYSTNETEIYNPYTNQVRKGPNMITGRKEHKAALLNNGKVFIIGGRYSDKLKKVDLKSTEFYNPKTNEFEKGPDLPVTLSYIRDIIQDKKMMSISLPAPLLKKQIVNSVFTNLQIILILLSLLPNFTHMVICLN